MTSVTASVARFVAATWRPLLVVASISLGWFQSGPSIDLRKLLEGELLISRTTPAHCTSVMIGYACSLKNGNDVHGIPSSLIRPQ